MDQELSKNKNKKVPDTRDGSRPVSYVSLFYFQPAHNDKTAHPEVARLMKELIRCRKQLKGQLHKKKHTLTLQHKNLWLMI